MSESSFYISQFNVARIRKPVDHPDMAGFVNALKPINALADTSPGFIWRLQTEAGDTTAIRPYPDDRLLITLSVWETIEDLFNFAYRQGHAEVMRGRRAWFEEMEQEYLVLWWTPAGHIPTVEEGMARLELLRRQGPTPDAFTFKTQFPNSMSRRVEETLTQSVSSLEG